MSLCHTCQIAKARKKSTGFQLFGFPNFRKLELKDDSDSFENEIKLEIIL